MILRVISKKEMTKSGENNNVQSLVVHMLGS